MSKAIITYQQILPGSVTTFLARSCFTSNGMHIPWETWVLILTLYFLNSALYFFTNSLKELHNLLYQTPLNSSCSKFYPITMGGSHVKSNDHISKNPSW